MTSTMKIETTTSRFLTPLFCWHCEQVLVALGLLALCPLARALSPAPDGGYPSGNTAEGQQALLSLTTGTYNTAVGLFSLKSNAESNFNTAIGAGALLANTADENTATGAGALLSNASGLVNTANGAFALFNNTQGAGNTATGAEALLRNTTGISNTAAGRGALSFSTGDSNTAIGYSAGINVTTASNVICIGANVAGADVSDSCYIGNIFNQTSFNGTPVFVNGDNKLGTTTSSQRFKEDIKPMDHASEALFSLKPVAFRYKKGIDPPGTAQFGLVAEDVEKVNPDLVVHDKEGKPYSVRYDQVNAMLLNEFLKEHGVMQQQRADIAELNKKIASLSATVKDQAAQIQKVSAQTQLSKPTQQTVLNNQ